MLTGGNNQPSPDTSPEDDAPWVSRFWLITLAAPDVGVGELTIALGAFITGLAKGFAIHPIQVLRENPQGHDYHYHIFAGGGAKMTPQEIRTISDLWSLGRIHVESVSRKTAKNFESRRNLKS